jgi:DNA-binding transcriptional ArsR family regulator
VTDALELFIAAIIRAVEREAVAALRAAFAREPARTERRLDSRRGTAAPSGAHAGLHLVQAPAGLADVREQVIARVRQAPGSTTGELSRSLGMSGDSVRRHLRKLVSDETIRFEERFSGFGGQRRRVYFMVELVPAAQPETSAITAEATA